MTEQEAIQEIKKIYIETNQSDKCIALKMAISALKEIQHYREIGTIEEIKEKISELKHWHTGVMVKVIKNPFANMSTVICHNCDHKDEYIEELESEIEEYRAVGTVATNEHSRNLECDDEEHAERYERKWIK